MVSIIPCSPLGGSQRLHCDQRQASLTERVNTKLFLRAPPSLKANTISVRPGRYIMKSSDLNLQSGTKETLLTSTDHQNLPDMVFLERNSGQVPAKSYGERIVGHRRRIGLVQEATGSRMGTVVFRWTETPSAAFPMIAYGPLAAKTWVEGARSQLLVTIRETAILIDHLKAGERTLVTVANGFTCCLFLLALFSETLGEHDFTLHVMFPPPIRQKATEGQVTSVQQWQEACRDADRVLFKDETEGICIHTKGRGWISLGLQQSEKRGMFDQGVISVMNRLQNLADESLGAGSRNGGGRGRPGGLTTCPTEVCMSDHGDPTFKTDQHKRLIDQLQQTADNSTGAGSRSLGRGIYKQRLPRSWRP
jgi:hypothetical protein